MVESAHTFQKYNAWIFHISSSLSKKFVKIRLEKLTIEEAGRLLEMTKTRHSR